METKKCIKCGKDLPLKNYRKQKAKYSFYYRTDCKKCCSEYIKNYYRTKKGLIKWIHTIQCRAYKARGKKWFPEYTLQEFQEWFSKQKNYDLLHENWVKSDYDKYKKPSVDRIDNKKNYTLDNIQLMTWKENDLKGRIERTKIKSCQTIK